MWLFINWSALIGWNIFSSLNAVISINPIQFITGRAWFTTQLVLKSYRGQPPTTYVIFDVTIREMSGGLLHHCIKFMGSPTLASVIFDLHYHARLVWEIDTQKWLVVFMFHHVMVHYLEGYTTGGPVGMRMLGLVHTKFWQPALTQFQPGPCRGDRLCPPYTDVITKFWKPQERLG